MSRSASSLMLRRFRTATTAASRCSGAINSASWSSAYAGAPSAARTITSCCSSNNSSSRKHWEGARIKRIATAATFSTAAAKKQPRSPHQPWLNSAVPVEQRVEALIEQANNEPLHVADFHNPALRQLLQDCCTIGTANAADRSQTTQQSTSSSPLEGLQLAQAVLDHLVQEKRRLQQQKESAVVFIPERSWQTVLYGWAVHAAKHPRPAISEMRKLVDAAVAEAKEDADRLDQWLASQTANTKKATTTTTTKTNTKVPVEPRFIEASKLTTGGLFNTYLFGLSEVARTLPQAATQAEAVLRQMTELHETLNNWHVQPNTKSYHLVLTAYAHTSGHRGAGKRALTLLRRMQQVHQTQKEAYLQEYGVPYSCNVAGNTDNEDAEDDNESSKDDTTTRNRRQIVTPDAIAYTLTMRALARHNPERSLEILQEAQQHIQLDAKIFTMAIKSLSHLIEKEKNALRRIESAQRAERILQMMKEYAATQTFSGQDDDDDDDSNNNNNNNRRGGTQQNPLLVGYNACLDAWSRAYCREAAPHCESILWGMLEEKDDNNNNNNNIIQPNTISFNSCQHAWSRSHKFHPDSGARAEQLLQRQIEACESGRLGDDALPDLQTYTICLLAQADATDADKLPRAVRLLNSLADGVADGVVAVARAGSHKNPNAPFSALLSVIAKSPPNAPASGGDGDDADAFTAVVETEADPYSLATSIYEDLLPNDALGIGSTAPDHHAMAGYLRCVAAHCPSASTERVATALRVLEDAQEAGKLSKLVLKALLAALAGSSEQNKIRDILNKPQQPEAWIRNVPAAFR